MLRACDVEPLPLFHEGVRALRRDRAASVRKEALQEWLKSEMAAAWRKEQAAIFGSGEGPPILRGPDEADEEEGGTEGLRWRCVGRLGLQGVARDGVGRLCRCFGMQRVCIPLARVRRNSI